MQCTAVGVILFNVCSILISGMLFERRISYRIQLTEGCLNLYIFMMTKIKVPCPAGTVFEPAKWVVRKLRDAGFNCYWVGGAVRDLVLGRIPDDVDMVTDAVPEELKKVFPDAEMVGACFGVVLVKSSGVSFEVATCREERSYGDGRRPDEVKFTRDFVRDLQRRDFTVNAMLYDPEAGEVFDYCGGLRDIELRLIRVVGNAEERFAEDYLRLFRAVRFAGKLNFELEDSTQNALKKMAHLSSKLAAERVREELEQMICSENPARALRLLRDCGLLAVWLPEVAALDGVEQHPVYHPEGDVWTHTLLMFERLQKRAEPLLAWSILLHDIGKKPTFSRDEDNIPHFYGHEAVGADMIRGIAQRLRFSRELAEGVEHAVRYHMRFASVREMRQAKLARLLAEKNFAVELELHRLDCLCSNGLMETYAFLSEKSKKMSSLSLPPPLLNGNDLATLGYKPGALFKKILNSVMDAQLEDKLADKKSALEFVKNNFPLG